MTAPLRCLIASDFNAANCAGLMENDEESPRLAPILAPIGPVVPALAADPGDATMALVWTLPETTIGAYRALLDDARPDAAGMRAEVDAFADAILAAAARLRWVFVASWVRDRGSDPRPSAAWREADGPALALARMNLRLAERLSEAPNVVMLDAERWLARAEGAAFDDKLWYQGKIPFAHAVFHAAVGDLKAAVRGLTGRSRKLVVLDLDDTLWGGIVGEVGWEGVRLGGHDAIGEAFVEFQRALKRLARRGVVLGVVSKNDESTALDVFRHHPEMQLRLDDLAGWKIGWGDKAGAIVDLVAELNLGLEATVFIDDHPVERARVREALPDVLVPEWPRHPMAYTRALLGLGCFDQPTISAEDRDRSRSYVTERERVDLRRRLGSTEDWLRSLETVVTIEPLGRANLARAAQLLNKTNQMNLTTRRMSEPELAEWSGRAGRSTWVFRVTDRFGDSGITGLASLSVENGSAQIVDFVMSCRVMGRKVEEAIVHALVDRARAAGATSVWAQFVPTPRNGPCRAFWSGSGFAAGPDDRFVWNGERAYALPDTVTLVRAPGA